MFLALQTKATVCLYEVSHGKWENNTHTNKQKPFLVYLLLSSALDQIISSLPLFGACSCLSLGCASQHPLRCTWKSPQMQAGSVAFFLMSVPTWLDTGSGGEVTCDLLLVLVFFSDSFLDASFYSFFHICLSLAYQVIRKPGTIFPSKMY